MCAAWKPRIRAIFLILFQMLLPDHLKTWISTASSAKAACLTATRQLLKTEFVALFNTPVLSGQIAQKSPARPSGFCVKTCVIGIEWNCN